MTQLAPGACPLILDDEWLIRRSDPYADSGRLLINDGVFDLVRRHNALRLTELEGEIEVIDPANTLLLSNAIATYKAIMIYSESQGRHMLSSQGHSHPTRPPPTGHTHLNRSLLRA